MFDCNVLGSNVRITRFANMKLQSWFLNYMSCPKKFVPMAKSQKLIANMPSVCSAKFRGRHSFSDVPSLHCKITFFMKKHFQSC